MNRDEYRDTDRFLIYFATLIALVVGVFLYYGFAEAQESRTPVTVVPGDWQSGATMDATSGVSLIMEIDLARADPLGYFSVGPGVLTFGGEGAGVQGDYRDNLDPGGTGGTDDSGVSLEFRYALSNKKLSTAQWEAYGISGTTLFGTVTVGSSTSPYPLALEPDRVAGWLGIFGASGMSQFEVPKIDVAYQ